ncbi:MAG: GNAT family N-acetyltransferase [Mariniblastus sp.]
MNEVRQHSRQLVREWDCVKGVYLGSGYTVSQCHVLFELAAQKSLTLMELAEILLGDKSNISRTIKQLSDMGLVKSKKKSTDNRNKFFSLTAQGKKALEETVGLADVQVASALSNLSRKQRQVVVDGLMFYSNALRKSRLQSPYRIRQIKKRDNPEIASVIRDVMTEFGAVGEGYSINDSEVDQMFNNYNDKRSRYFVIEKSEGEVVGGAGIGPLAGGDSATCELRKMFFRPEVRGVGFGKRLLLMLMDEARKKGYTQCYLETLDRMEQASALYRNNGFVLLESALGKTGHCSCDSWYLLKL